MSNKELLEKTESKIQIYWVKMGNAFEIRGRRD